MNYIVRRTSNDLCMYIDMGFSFEYSLFRYLSTKPINYFVMLARAYVYHIAAYGSDWMY